jgi:hypothetical protein
MAMSPNKRRGGISGSQNASVTEGVVQNLELHNLPPDLIPEFILYLLFPVYKFKAI